MTQPTYDPHNPHPLSQMRTELVWEGKYDEYGQRREVDIAFPRYNESIYGGIQLCNLKLKPNPPRYTT